MAQAEIGILHEVCVGDFAGPATAFRPLFIKVAGASGGTSVESEAARARQIAIVSYLCGEASRIGTVNN